MSEREGEREKEQRWKGNITNWVTKNSLILLQMTITFRIQITGMKEGFWQLTDNFSKQDKNPWFYEAKRPNLKLKTRPKQPLGYLLLDTALPGQLYFFQDFLYFESSASLFTSCLFNKTFFILAIEAKAK
jgi:hypothetical protein